MPVVSISLNDHILSELDSYQKSMGFSGRSEIIRAGIRAFVSDEKQKAGLSGKVNAILLVIHDDDFDSVASELGGDHEEKITTRMHSKIEGKRCMDLFVLKGEAEDIVEMERKYRANKHMDTVEMIIF